MVETRRSKLFCNVEALLLLVVVVAPRPLRDDDECRRNDDDDDTSALLFLLFWDGGNDHDDSSLLLFVSEQAGTAFIPGGLSSAIAVVVVGGERLDLAMVREFVEVSRLMDHFLASCVCGACGSECLLVTTHNETDRRPYTHQRPSVASQEPFGSTSRTRFPLSHNPATMSVCPKMTRSEFLFTMDLDRNSLKERDSFNRWIPPTSPILAAVPRRTTTDSLCCSTKNHIRWGHPTTRRTVEKISSKSSLFLLQDDIACRHMQKHSGIKG